MRFGGRARDLTAPRRPTARGRFARTMTSIVLRHVTKTYGDREGETIVALDDVSLKVHDNEFVSILGPSGCGKRGGHLPLGPRGDHDPRPGRVLAEIAVPFDRPRDERHRTLPEFTALRHDIYLRLKAVHRDQDGAPGDSR